MVNATYWMHADMAYDQMAARAAIESIEGPILTIKKDYIVLSDPFTIATFIAKLIGSDPQSFIQDEYWVFKSGVVYAQVDTARGDAYYDNQDSELPKEQVEMSSVRDYIVTASGKPDVVRDLFVKLDDELASKKYASIRWWSKGQHGLDSKRLFLAKPTTKLYPELYPVLGDPTSFIKEYLKSDASILLLAGAPGTGKTTLLRHMITDNNLCADVVYDESIMGGDAVFQNFLFSKDSDILIIEDADVILQSREHENNKLMARFLNVSDGLIKLPNKKLVFTTNLTAFGRVDPALLRPGRCYGMFHTRSLNLEEAKAACKVAGLPMPVERREYTLAEIFNANNAKAAPSFRRIGFVK